jgi:hypothetical protein
VSHHQVSHVLSLKDAAVLSAVIIIIIIIIMLLSAPVYTQANFQWWGRLVCRRRKGVCR